MLTSRSTKSNQGRQSRPPPSREVEYKFISETINNICYDIKSYAQKFFTQKHMNYSACQACYREIVKSWKLNPESFQTWKDFFEKLRIKDVDNDTKKKEIYTDLINTCERSKEFEVMIPRVRETLVKCVKEHVYKYCHSFAEETGGVDARPVLDYEETIRSYRKQIETKIDSINADIIRYSDIKSPFDKFIADGGIIGTLMENICVQLVETSHEVKKWISDDAAYPDKLLQEILFNNGYRDKLQEDGVKLQKRRSSLERSLERREKISRRVEKEFRSYKREKRKIKQSLHTVSLKIEKLEVQIKNKCMEIRHAQDSLTPRKPMSPRQEDELHIKLEKDKKEVDRLNEWLNVSQRQKSRLEKEFKEVSDRTYEFKVEFITNRNEQDEMKQSLLGMDIEWKSLQERLEGLDRKTAVMKHVRLLKMSPETLRKLYRRRREFYQQGEYEWSCRLRQSRIHTFTTGKSTIAKT